MALELVTEYATEGAPLFIADQATSARWRGLEDDGTGAVVEYMTARHADLPAAYVQTKRPGMQRKRFPSVDDARAFERELVPVLETLHPGAARPARHPGHPGFYQGERRVFSVEVKFTSMFASVVARLDADVECVAFEKGRKARALFMQQQGGGRGLVAVDARARTLVVARLSAGADARALLRAVAAVAVPKSKLKPKLPLAGAHVLAFDSARSWAEIAQKNPGLAAASGTCGPLGVAGQKLPGGAFASVPAGTYALAYRPSVDLGGAVASILWLTPPP